MIVVTGGAGFIGSNVVRSLVADGCDVAVVDDLSRPEKFDNIAGVPVVDFVDKSRLDELLAGARSTRRIEAVVHQGASSSTMHPDGRYVMENNYEFSRALLDRCLAAAVPLIYASSAAVYGSAGAAVGGEGPLNVYAFSKWLFDQYVRSILPVATSQVVGLRYFNVYGPGESHKGEMASVISRFDDAIAAGEAVRVFGEGAGARAGQHRRDFVAVADVVAVIRWFLDHRDRSGIFDCGTGVARPFDDVARAVIAARGRGRVEYVPFPEQLAGRYQSHTQADLSALRAVGCEVGFSSLDDGIAAYLAARSVG